MKKLILSATLLLLCISTFGQITQQKTLSNSANEVEKCSQQLKMDQLMITDPVRFATINTAAVGQQQAHYTPSIVKSTGLIYTIPVVFHVLHNNGSENISEAQILNQLAILNRDFARLNADADQVDPAFIGMPTDAEIQFVLATVAPNGACFSGITRTVTTLTNNGSDGQAQISAVIAGNDVFQGIWPHNRYLNVYVANDIGGAAGYTFLPNGGSVANASGMYYNGVFILHNYCGAIGTGSTFRSRSLTHEFGHWMNLPHVWGAGNTPGTGTNCNQDDGVQDTPNCTGVTSCNLNANTCNSDDAYWGMAMKDNVENYMDYSYCSKMYTQGQVTRMRTALTSSTGGRSNIWTTANLNLVGGGPGTSLCALDFSANQTTLCAGVSITYTPNITAGVASYSWTFPGGTPATSTAQNPTVTYATVGNYNATLTVTATSNGASYSKSKTSYITVNSNTTVSLPISEGFTATTFPPTGWTIVNASGGTWTRSGTVGRAPTAGNSARFDNYNLNDSGNDELRLPKANLSTYASAQMTFDVAYAAYNASYYDGLEVLVSTDCGGTFTTVYSKSNAVLATANATTGSFAPTTAQWRTETINLTPFVGNNSVWVAFRNLAGNGNNLYIDNVNVTGVVGTATANFSASASTVCTTQNVTYTDASTSATSWSWNFGTGATPATATGAGPHTVSYSSAGTKTISLTVNGSSTSTQNVTVNATPSAPTISAGSATTFCQGGSVVLTSSAGSGNVWSTGATTPSITVSASGTYSVTRTTTGCTSPSSVPTTITVNPVPSAPTISTGGSTTFCQGGSVVLTSSTASGNTWSTGATTQSITVSSSGTYNVTTTSGGCTSSASSGTTVTVNPIPSAPSISAGGATSFCQGGSVVLTSSSGSGNVWSTGATTQSITVSSSGTYNVTTTSGGCTSSASSGTTVTVNPSPNAPTISAGGSTSFCQGGSVVLTSSATSGNTWSTGATTQSITVSSTGTYNVTSTSGGCTSSASSGTIVTVNPIPSAPSISASGATSFCQGGSVVLTSSSGSGNVWSTGATTQSITVSSSGTYNVTTTSGGCTSSASSGTTVTVNPSPNAPTISAGSSTTFCQGGSVVLSSSATSGNTWSTGATTQSITVTNPGTYTVIESNGGCSSAGSNGITITVNNSPTVTFASITNPCLNDVAFTLTQGAPSGGTYSGNGVNAGQFNPSIAGIGTTILTYSYSDVNNCTAEASISVTVDGCSGINENETSLINIYPNPSKGQFTIDAGSSIIENIMVFDNAGRLVQVVNGTNETSESLTLINMANGFYKVYVVTDSNAHHITIVLEK